MRQSYFAGRSLRVFTILCLSATAFSLQFCKTKAPKITAVSYEKEVKPLLVKNCTPCHFPEQGKKKMLDTYEAARDNVTDILKRVQLDPTADGFMPFKSKKAPLTPAEIQLLKDWVATGTSK